MGKNGLTDSLPTTNKTDPKPKNEAEDGLLPGEDLPANRDAAHPMIGGKRQGRPGDGGYGDL